MRLREIRKDAGLTGRALAAATGWHFTRISKIENGAQSPTDQDLRTWCGFCAAEEQVPDLIAQARAVESMYLEFKRQARAGLKQFMLAPVPLYERTERFRIYEHHAVPGLFQTAEYMRAMLKFWFGFLDTRNDMDEAVEARMVRQGVLYQSSKTFSVVLEEAALSTRFGGSETLAGQLDRLLSVMSLPNVSIGIVPRNAERDVIGQAGFWIFDDKLVSLETPTASIEVTQPQEVSLYARMFDHLRRPALYGRDARRIIVGLQNELSGSNQ
ncbi:helix-turn-helix protein [Kribbella amoyensis]|uniref:Helix-turn-helix protein n=1 Tax=Kribbella amoyensis TaxID=996641 RepID=A0A561BMA7_9ACTN|nr:helix-turn-helix transcriptional regulator [Kribbella amoyensis]TWD80036.1 helix-turn-helix protein [Kribbella amoyensis]